MPRIIVRNMYSGHECQAIEEGGVWYSPVSGKEWKPEVKKLYEVIHKEPELVMTKQVQDLLDSQEKTEEVSNQN